MSQRNNNPNNPAYGKLQQYGGSQNRKTTSRGSIGGVGGVGGGYPLRKASTGDDFFTDSIMSDGSKIPTPSPSKSESISAAAAAAAAATKPRRAIGTTKSLRAAWDATGRNDRSSPRASDLPTVRHIKPEPAPAARRESPAAQQHQQQLPELRTRNATPSPARRRKASELTSPESTISSPPKALTEAYQRIADEEVLAGLEGDFSDEDYDFTESQDVARGQLGRVRKSDSSLSSRNSRKPSPLPNGFGMRLQNDHGQDNTVASRVSGLSFLDQLTDQDLAAKLTPGAVERARDKERLQRAVQRDSPIAFGRAQLGYNGSNSADNLSLRSSTEDLTRTSTGSNGSVRSDRLDMAVNVPKAWGSKGKVGKEWLNKIHRKDAPQEKDSSIVDWMAAAADTPLPQNGDSRSIRTGSSRDSTPVGMRHKSSLDRLRQWELNDFTGASFQVSNSPPVRPRNPAIDQIRDLEIENLERRAVTTRRLDQLRRSESPDKPRKSSPPVELTAAEPAPRVEEPKSTKSVKFQDQEGESIPNTPIVVFKNGHRAVSDSYGVKRPARDSLDDLQRLSRAISESPRPASPDEDKSLALGDFLWKRRGNDDTGIQDVRAEKPAATPLPSRLNALDLAAETPVVTGAWTETILPDTVKTNRKTPGTARAPKTPHITGGWVDTPAPTSKRLAPPQELPEGLANGIVSSQEQPKQPEPSKETAVAPAVEKTTISRGSRSALATLLSKARGKVTASSERNDQDTQDVPSESPTEELPVNLGELTIESLEDLLTLDNADMTTLMRMSAELEAKRTLNNASSAKFTSEEELLGRLGSKLERLQTNIHSARKGISKLERSVSNPASTDPDKQLVVSPTTNTGLTTVKNNENTISCPFCGSGCSHNSSPNTTTISLTLPFRLNLLPQSLQLLHPRKPTQILPRPTPFGYLLLSLWTYYILESLLCIQYCHPLYADIYIWPSEPEPKFGAVIPTLLWRNTGLRWLWKTLFSGPAGTALAGGPIGLILKLLIAIYRLIAQSLGFTDGFIDVDVGGGAANFDEPPLPPLSATTTTTSSSSSAQGLIKSLSQVFATAVTKAAMAGSNAGTGVGIDTEEYSGSMDHDEFL